MPYRNQNGFFKRLRLGKASLFEPGYGIRLRVRHLIHYNYNILLFNTVSYSVMNDDMQTYYSKIIIYNDS